MVIIIVLSFSLLIGCLYNLSVLKHEEYEVLSNNNVTRTILIPAVRGNVLDRNNIKLTDNKIYYSISIYGDSKDKDYVINDIINYSNFTSKEKNRQLARAQRERNKFIVPILSNVDFDIFAPIMLNYYKYNDLDISSIKYRNYEYPTTFAHIIGYISNPDENEVKKLKKDKNKSELLLNPDYKIGKNGIEKSFNSLMGGEVSYKQVEVNAFNKIVKREYNFFYGKAGNDVKLTLDYRLQRYIEDRLGNTSGSVVVMNVKTGEIVAMVSKPSFDPNKFVDGVSAEYWNELNNHVSKPMQNKAISATYPPGSTFKPIVALAGLENNWSPNQIISCSGELRLDKSRILHCWTEHGHGPLNLEDAIQHSCNIYFSKIGVFAGITKIYDIATKFGFGEKFDINLENVKQGVVPNIEWKKKVLKDVWVSGDTVNVSIGQGFLSVTPLELVVMTARIANGGYPVKPYLVFNSSVADYNKKLFYEEPMVKTNNINIVKNGMYKVVNKIGGTAYRYRLDDKDYAIAGKTGTAQVINKEKAKEFQKFNRTNLKHHALFIAFAPFHDPKYAISVVIEHGEAGSTAGAPVARDIFGFIRDNDI